MHAQSLEQRAERRRRARTVVGLVAIVALGLLDACKGDPADVPAPAAVPVSSVRVSPGVPGVIWFVRDGAPARLGRVGAGRVRELAERVFPSMSTLPDGRLVAVSSRGDGSPDGEQLVLVAADGKVEPLGPAGGEVRDPAVDPQGRWIIVAAMLDGHSDLYRLDPAGGEPRRITNDPEGNFHPVTLGTDAIVFVSSRDGDSEIYRSDASGGHVQRLTAFHKDDWDPTVSPDHATIAFLSDREGAPRVFLMKPDGTGQRRLTSRAPDEAEEGQLVWSPDGARVAYLVARGEDRHVWLREIASGAERDLTPAGAADEEPSFSPDGAWIAVSRTRGRDVHLWAVPAAGGDAVQVTSGVGADRLPRWR